MTDSASAMPQSWPALAPSVRAALCMTSLGAAAIHFAVLGEHFDEYVPFGVFYIVVAWSQAIWAVWIVAAASRQLLIAGLLGNLVTIAMWIVSLWFIHNPAGVFAEENPELV